MRRVLKYHLEQGVFQQIVRMSEGAKILSVQMVNGELYFWAEVDNSKRVKERHIIILGTGDICPPEHMPYIGTVQDDPYIWHIYDGGYAA